MKHIQEEPTEQQWPTDVGEYDGQMVKAPINQGEAFPAIYQWTDGQGEWYLVNGLRCEAREIEPYLA